MIKQALYINGYNPSFDELLKAYHIATKKFIDDPEVRESVVWMKYDKCRIGDYIPGDKPDLSGIKLFNLEGKQIWLKDLISFRKPNLIVGGSLS